MNVYSNILDMVGETPMLEVTHIDTGLCRLFLKLELMNPGGSIKDRIGISMIEQAEKRGDIKPGDTLVEATAGNTGIGLALVAAQKGYHLILVLPDKMSQPKSCWTSSDLRGLVRILGARGSELGLSSRR